MFTVNYIPQSSDTGFEPNIKSELPISLTKFSSMKEFVSTASSSPHANLLIVDLELLIKENSAAELTNTLAYMSNIEKSANDQPCNLVLAVPEKLTTEMLNTIGNITCAGACYLTPKVCKKTAIDIARYIENTTHLPSDLATAMSVIRTRSDNIKLTSCQHEILTLILDRGLGNKEIAQHLDLAESTVKLHISTLFKKFNVRSRAQLIVFTKTN